MKEITLLAVPQNLEKAIEFVGSDDMQIGIAIEEIFINICSYAYTDSGCSGDVTIRANWEGYTLTIEFEDIGAAYNPLEKGDPDDLDAETSADKNVGGYGIFMVRQIMDSVSYRREGGRNILTISKNMEDS